MQLQRLSTSSRFVKIILGLYTCMNIVTFGLMQLHLYAFCWLITEFLYKYFFINKYSLCCELSTIKYSKPPKHCMRSVSSVMTHHFFPNFHDKKSAVWFFFQTTIAVCDIDCNFWRNKYEKFNSINPAFSNFQTIASIFRHFHTIQALYWIVLMLLKFMMSKHEYFIKYLYLYFINQNGHKKII